MFPGIRSLDHGLSNATCCLFGFIDYDGNMVIHDEHYEAMQSVSYHAREIKAKSRGHDFHWSVADPSIFNKSQQSEKKGVYTVAEEYLENGIEWEPADNTFNAGINRVIELMNPEEDRLSIYHPSLRAAPKLYVTSNCVNLRKEIKSYQWAKVRLQFSAYKEKPKTNCADHACDALRYAAMTLPEPADLPKRKPRMDPCMINFKERLSRHYHECMKEAMKKDPMEFEGSDAGYV